MPYTIPANIGLAPGCEEVLHTHDTSGLIHVESDVNRLYTLRDFFTIWGNPFGQPTAEYVNGTSVAVSPAVVLWDRESIELQYASFP